MSKKLSFVISDTQVCFFEIFEKGDNEKIVLGIFRLASTVFEIF